MRCWAILAALVLTGCRPMPPPGVETIEIPDGDPGIGFDDLQFSTQYGVLVPAGRTGTIALIDPATRKVTTIGGFGAEPLRFAGHNQGPTSMDAGGGFFFVVDRTRAELAVVEAGSQQIVGRVAVAGPPDYVRYVEQTNEAWVTEPDAEQLEVFSLEGGHPSRAALLPIPGGPESLIIDHQRDRAYAHLWGGATIAIDVHARSVVAQWDNGCFGSRGIALDEAHGLVVAACAEGRLAVLDAAHDGATLSSLSPGAEGLDVIGYAAALGHLYAPGSTNTTLSIVDLAADGTLTLLGTTPTIEGASCATADDRGNAYVCDVENGELLVFPDFMSRRAP
jgi:hypothetical protein